MVYIKRVKTGDNESRIATMMWSEDLRHDPRNHSVPVLDIFQDDEDPTISYLVMPFLRLIDRPAFDLVEEMVDFIDQILEVRGGVRLHVHSLCTHDAQGLVFMHEHGVAHRYVYCIYPESSLDTHLAFQRLHVQELNDGCLSNVPARITPDKRCIPPGCPNDRPSPCTNVCARAILLRRLWHIDLHPARCPSKAGLGNSG